MTAERIGGNDDEAALLLRPSFEPIDFITIEPRFGQSDGLRHDEIGCDWRFPGAVGRSLGHACTIRECREGEVHPGYRTSPRVIDESYRPDCLKPESAPA